MQTVITGETYSLDWDPEARSAALKGILRLNGLEEYAPISRFLLDAVPQGSMILDLRGLEFVIEIRNRKSVDLTILGSKAVAWQSKSLVNLSKLMPTLRMEFV